MPGQQPGGAQPRETCQLHDLVQLCALLLLQLLRRQHPVILLRMYKRVSQM